MTRMGIAPRGTGGRRRTGSICVRKDGSIWARVRFKDEHGRIRYRVRRAQNLDHANLLREDLLAEIPKKHEPGYEPRALNPDTPALQKWDNLSIYCIRLLDGQTQPIKIGIAKDVGERIKALLTALPYELELLGTWPAEFRDEQALHKHFQHLRIRREWFRPEPELLDYIAENQRRINVGELVVELEKVVLPARFQLAASRLGGERSMQLSYGSTSVLN